MPILEKLPHILYGADYNPEQWPEEIWAEDVRLMREAGVNLVSLGIFSWVKLEPRPGEYDFGWLDRIMDLLYEHGVLVDLATATASPPPWLAKLHPESLPVTSEGVTLWPGARQHYCPSSPAYREQASRLVQRIADRYKDHPALALWHVNNEYGCHVSECYCDVSAAHFRRWLKDRYGDLDTLNEAWGTAFWSQRYNEWAEILPPRAAPTFPNPTQQLDFRRFSSDALLECFTMEKNILREATPDVPVTTNFMGAFKSLDYWKWVDLEDVVSNDSYPDPASEDARVEAALSFDLMRSLGHGRPWILMEQTTARVNWRTRNVPKKPGQMRLWSYEAVARGADGVMFFQWRASKAGAEKFHSAMVPHGGTEGSQTWDEAVQLGTELGRLDAIVGAGGPAAEVAVVLDWENWWALELDSKPSGDLRLMEGLLDYYKPLFEQNFPVDFVHPEADLSGYRVLLVPNLYLTRQASAANLEHFVESGGTLVVSFFSGIVDGWDHVWTGGYPAPLRRLLGLRVEDFVPLAAGEEVSLVAWDGVTYKCELWIDRISLEDTETTESLATYTDNLYAGIPAVTRHGFGDGIAYYLGTRPERAFMSRLLNDVCYGAGVKPSPEVPTGVSAVRRTAENRSFLFLLNHNPESVEVTLDHQARDLLTGQDYEESVQLGPLGVAILEDPT